MNIYTIYCEVMKLFETENLETYIEENV